MELTSLVTVVSYISIAIGSLSGVYLCYIFYNYYDMYPWFGGVRKELLGYYLLPFGLFLLSSMYLMNNIIGTSLFAMIVIIVNSIIWFTVSATVLKYIKEFLVTFQLRQQEDTKLSSTNS